ncbi:MAG: hypothetical protein U9R25_09505 [Chloroflexota bacterium]|nr:hypothetical protein [Chloroflexota bacterium]
MPRQLTAPTRLLLVSVVLALLLGSLAACSAVPSAPPPGTYTATLVEADLPSELPDEVRAFLQGTWEMTFGDDHRFQGYKDGDFMVEGRYTSTQDQIVFTDEKGPAADPDIPGTYKWNFDGKTQTLTLTLIDDESLRALVLAAHPLTKQK